MIQSVCLFCLVVIALAMLPALYRIVQGPSVPDRAVAADALTTYIMATVVVVSIYTSTRVYFDMVMALAVLAFFGTVCVAKYILGGRPID